MCILLLGQVGTHGCRSGRIDCVAGSVLKGEDVADFESGSLWATDGYDVDAVRAKYRQERDKRFRPDGPDQYRVVMRDGDLGYYGQDPYVQREEREPVTDEVEVAVIGGGLAGMLLGARLRKIGVTNLRVVEQAGDFGGTWYWNRYPGIACDVESYIYLPLLEEVGYMPVEKYSKGSEIFAYFQKFAKHFDLYRQALLQTRVTEVRWNDKDGMWTITTDRGDRFFARYVCMTFGTFLHPKLPGILGIEDFTGKSFHTSRWDYEYTGGDSHGNLTGLRNKRVGIIGSGATAVQCVPMVAKEAKQLIVFQRTPAIVDVRENRPTDPEWAASLSPGWQQERIENFSACIAGEDVSVDLVNDSWTKLLSTLRKTKVLPDKSAAEAMELADHIHMESVRDRVSEVVRDRAIADALKPYYRYLCKRPCFHDEYLQAFNRPNVVLVDTDGRGVDRVTENGVVASDVEYDLDCLIFATGFASIRQDLKDRLGYDVFGRNGQALSDKWKDGISTLYGAQTRNFPNFFIVSYFQTGVASNQTHPLDEQARHISNIIRESRERGAIVDVAEVAEDEWVRTVIAASTASAEFLESCTPSYYNNEGHPNVELFRRNGPYSPGILAFSRIIREWRASGDYAGLEFESHSPREPRLSA